jgi:glucosamine--fructose-6-phosphate aminotransferase (isomerizing)
MTPPGHFTYEEIISQPEAWAQALEICKDLGGDFKRLWLKKPASQVLFTGCGSTYYLSLAAAALFTSLTGSCTRAIPAGDLYLYPQTYIPDGIPILLVAISRSGTTSETLAAVRRFRSTNSNPVACLTNHGDSPLAQESDLAIVIPAGQEKSVAQTRSFASMYIATTALAAQVAGHDDLQSVMAKLPQQGEKLIAASHSNIKPFAERLDLDRFYFLGSGPRYGLACETNLKMKEMTLTHSEPFHFLEFRHGPMSMVGGHTAVIGLRSSACARYEGAVLEDMAALGASVFVLAESDADVNFHSEIPAEVRNVLYLPPLQLMAYYRSMAKGLDPDQPQNLTAVVRLDLGEGERR